MTRFAKRLYEGSLKNKQFLAEVESADNDTPPEWLSEGFEIKKHLWAMMYYGWLVGMYKDKWESKI